jgi:hypothetical protein
MPMASFKIPMGIGPLKTFKPFNGYRSGQDVNRISKHGA